MSTQSLVASAMQEYLSRPGVTETAMFGSPGLKVQGKYFALLVKGKLVVKLTKDKVEQLVEAGTGDFFDPGHGRKMKEWFQFEPKSKKTCIKYMDEAIEIVSTLASSVTKKKTSGVKSKKSISKKKARAKA